MHLQKTAILKVCPRRVNVPIDWILLLTGQRSVDWLTVHLKLFLSPYLYSAQKHCLKIIREAAHFKYLSDTNGHETNDDSYIDESTESTSAAPDMPICLTARITVPEKK
ncbi:hypothetical protein Nepgr_006459 [Nepenthes gracilis]|uniref:Uncharacterized protein n=1 Tax=Nepenthes gracilis TaxID=150966 RepID=A0AAD3XHD4_NEPGR|nr:hypothetical protein Nepgr_006459 [Nepenthes gracilis]